MSLRERQEIQEVLYEHGEPVMELTLQPNIAEVVNAMHLDSFLAIFDSEQEALKSFDSGHNN